MKESIIESVIGLFVLIIFVSVLSNVLTAILKDLQPGFPLNPGIIGLTLWLIVFAAIAKILSDRR
ncbi:hypothetical protein HY991_01120 [Candidatus Micrarchaeota archaeon]|nr:hypothetical protein [Candidatus Micrarchaeota archaeon]